MSSLPFPVGERRQFIEKSPAAADADVHDPRRSEWFPFALKVQTVRFANCAISSRNLAMRSLTELSWQIGWHRHRADHGRKKRKAADEWCRDVRRSDRQLPAALFRMLGDNHTCHE